MVTLKLREDGDVDVTLLLPVIEKPLGNVYAGNGFSPKDLKSHGFNVVMTSKEVHEFFGDFVIAYNELWKKKKLQTAGSSS